MSSKEILDYIRALPMNEKRALTHEQLISIMKKLTTDEVIELSGIIGYPVFTRLCMGEELKHRFVLLQDGAAVIIKNKQGQILMQRRVDNDKWGLPGGCQEVGESFEEVAIREVKEETNLDIKKEDLELIAVVSGPSRRNSYPTGDVVFNNTALFVINTYKGDLKQDYESKELKFFDINFIPEHQNDPDLINIYINCKK